MGAAARLARAASPGSSRAISPAPFCRRQAGAEPETVGPGGRRRALIRSDGQVCSRGARARYSAIGISRGKVEPGAGRRRPSARDPLKSWASRLSVPIPDHAGAHLPRTRPCACTSTASLPGAAAARARAWAIAGSALKRRSSIRCCRRTAWCARCLPEEYAITRAAEPGEGSVFLRLEVRLRDGLRLIQVRKGLWARCDDGVRRACAGAFACPRREGAGELDVDRARVGADGVHLTAAQVAGVPGAPTFWCGARATRGKSCGAPSRSASFRGAGTGARDALASEAVPLPTTGFGRSRPEHRSRCMRWEASFRATEQAELRCARPRHGARCLDV